MLRIQSGRYEAAGLNRLAGCQFNTRRAAIANEDAAQLDAATDFAPMLSDVGHEAVREAGRTAHRHLRLRP